MEKVDWSERSKGSLHRIWKFYAEKSIDAANKIILEIIDTAENIPFAEQYQKEEFLESRHRRVIFKHFKIIYSKTSNGIKVMQVFDTRQDPENMKF